MAALHTGKEADPHIKISWLGFGKATWAEIQGWVPDPPKKKDHLLLGFPQK